MILYNCKLYCERWNLTMKIKIFTNNMSLSEMERDINDFIKDKKVIDIKQSESNGGQDSFFCLNLTVLYED